MPNTEAVEIERHHYPKIPMNSRQMSGFSQYWIDTDAFLEAREDDDGELPLANYRKVLDLKLILSLSPTRHHGTDT
jgi:hypothetical protein